MEPLHVRFIIEILGKPKDHVSFTMNALVERLGKEKGVSITHQTVHEPRKVEGSKELFATFAEMEARFDSLSVFFGIIFAYMPSNIEIMSPSSLKLTNEEVTTVGNALISRLHLYESVTKKLVGDRDALINKLKSMGVNVEQAPPQKPDTKAKPKKKKR